MGGLLGGLSDFLFGSPPAPPDPAATAAAQTKANQDTASFNAGLSHVNQYTPYGSLTYSQTGTNPDGSPQYNSNYNLTPTSQQQVSQQQAQDLQLSGIAGNELNQAGQALSTPVNAQGIPDLQYGATADNIGTTKNVNGSPIQNSLDYSNLSSIPTSSADFAQAGQQAQNAVMSRSQPEIDHEQQALNNQLQNQGITPGSDAWSYAQKQFGQQANDMTQQAVLAGNQQQNQLYQQALASRQQLQNESNTQGNFFNAAQNQGFSQGQQNAALRNSAQAQKFQENTSNASLNNSAAAQALQQRIALQQAPLNEYNALTTNAQLQAPQFQTYGQGNAQAGNLMGMTQGNYNQAVGERNNLMSGFFNLAGAATSAAKASDRRLKENIVKIGKTPAGINIYEYTYKDNPKKKQTGVMAQEVEKIIPAAVIMRQDGYKMVNYAMVR